MRHGLASVPIELHGWDARTQSWHGPDEIAYNIAPCRRILDQLRTLTGSWYGVLHSNHRSEMPLDIRAYLRDLGDAGLALLDIEGSPGGPLAILLAVPAERRPRLRPDFAFEFVSFLRFLEGPETVGSELALHDYIQNVLSQATAPKTQLFSIESAHVLPEYEIVLAEHSEKLAMSLIAWMAEKDAVPAHPKHRVHA